MAEKSKSVNSQSQKELDKLEKQFDEFDSQVKEMTLDRMNSAPKEEIESQTKLSQKDIEKSQEIRLKPKRTIPCHPKDKFNERFRENYNFSKQYVCFTAENKEIIGESLTLWTRPFGGLPAEEWDVPVNKPVWGPRHLAERIKGCKYHRLIMSRAPTENTNMGQFYGTMVADTIVQRLDAIPVSNRKSIFMGEAA